MNPSSAGIPVFDAVIVEEELQFTLLQLGRSCNAERRTLVALVQEGVLLPLGGTDLPADPDLWRFDGRSLARTRSAIRLSSDLQLGVEAVALVFDLLDEIDALKRRLHRAGPGLKVAALGTPQPRGYPRPVEGSCPTARPCCCCSNRCMQAHSTHAPGKLSPPLPSPLPIGQVGLVQLPGTDRRVWWTGRVAIGLRYERPPGAHLPGTGGLCSSLTAGP